MEAKLDFKRQVTKIKLNKTEVKNNRLMALLALRGARFEKETSRFVWYEAPGNILPLI
ncbi:hypothetical protein [Anaerosinus sp.]